jgi:glycerate kinase
VLCLGRHPVRVRGPLGEPVDAWCGLSAGNGLALVEVAAAIGLPLVPIDRRDPLRASSYGAGELLVAARCLGARQILIGAGGVATVDGGAGLISALHDHGCVDLTGVEVLCDVQTPFERAAAVYGPQKGASPEQVRQLEGTLATLATTWHRDPVGVPGTAAGGGLAGALWAHGAELVGGAARVLDLLAIDQRLSACDVVVTGEGALDEQTGEGKLVSELAARARRFGVPVVAVAGRSDVSADQAQAWGIAHVVCAGTPEQLRNAGRRVMYLVNH